MFVFVLTQEPVILVETIFSMAMKGESAKSSFRRTRTVTRGRRLFAQASQEYNSIYITYRTLRKYFANGT